MPNMWLGGNSLKNVEFFSTRVPVVFLSLIKLTNVSEGSTVVNKEELLIATGLALSWKKTNIFQISNPENVFYLALFE